MKRHSCKLSHRFRHTFAVELLKAEVDIRKVSKGLGHSSVTITEKYYAKWNKAQQDLLDADLTGAWGKSPKALECCNPLDCSHLGKMGSLGFREQPDTPQITEIGVYDEPEYYRAE